MFSNVKNANTLSANTLSAQGSYMECCPNNLTYSRSPDQWLSFQL